MITTAVYEHPVFGSIRLVCQDNTLYYCAKDIAELMEFADSGSAVHNHCSNVRKFVHLSRNHRTAIMNFIDIRDVCHLAIFSRTDEAIRLFNWLKSDIMRRQVSAMFVNDAPDEDEPKENEKLQQAVETANEEQKCTEPEHEQSVPAAPENSKPCEEGDRKEESCEEDSECSAFFDMLFYAFRDACREAQKQAQEA